MKILKRIMRSLSNTKPVVVIPDDISYTHHSFETFSELVDYMKRITTLDEGRHAMHYLFQGLYDLLNTYSHPELEQLYRKVVDTGIVFYSSYYLGNGNIQVINELVPELEVLREHDDKYFYKCRGNFDGFGRFLYASSVGNFCEQCIDNSYNFDVIVGVACSASEPAMALAGLMQCPLHFIRYSKRRSDDEVTVLSFVEEEITESVKMKNVLITDDCVDTGNSMKMCVEHMRELGPITVKGACIHSNHAIELETILSQPNFSLYE